VTDQGPGPATATAAAVRSGRVSAVAAVEEALRRIGAGDGSVGAVVALRPDDALAEAAALDRAHADGRVPGPLAGVPVLVKDLEDVAGMPTRRGSLLFAQAPAATEDELVPAALRAAGAVVVGKTNLPELATEGFTDNLLHGPTRNPWDLARSPGGSSGGSAAAIAAGFVPVATATDGGGSVRIPAALCGLLGLKPTHGAVGRWPVADWIDLSTYGPLATSSDDLRLLLSLMGGRAAGDPSSAPGSFDPLQHRAVAASHLLVAERTSPLGPLPDAVRSAFDDACTALADLLGLPLRRLDPGEVFAGLGDPDLDWFTLATAEHVAALGREHVLARMADLHPATRAFLGDGLSVTIDDYLGARRRRPTYTHRLDELLGDRGLLLTPTVAATGWTPDGRLAADDVPGMLPPEVYSTAVQNVTGHPALSLPAGTTSPGTPFGLQVTAPRWRDDLLLDLADAWQSGHPWPRTAPGYRPFSV
jgi:Asp-tRNA(Asn)/Glu-tRNA(Gln) amidotransferase A subunit family amidase